MARPNMNIDITNEETKKAALTAFDSTSIPAQGKHLVTIDKAYITYTPNGSAWLNLFLQVENGKVYKIKQKCLTAGEDKGFEPTHEMKKLTNLIYLLGVNGNTAQTKISVTKYENGQPIESLEEFESYVGLIGKKVGAIIRYVKEYPNSLGVDGYTNRPIPEKSIDPDGYAKIKSLPSTIWMPNYSKEPQPTFDVTLFFDYDSNKTLKELQDDNLTEPTEVNTELEKIMKYKSEYPKLTGVEWDKERKKRLIKNLKRHGEEFNPSRFIACSSDIDVDVSSDEVLYDYDDVE